MELSDLSRTAFDREPRLFVDLLPPLFPQDGDLWYRLGVERIWTGGGWHPAWDGGTVRELTYDECKRIIFRNAGLQRSLRHRLRKSSEQSSGHR